MESINKKTEDIIKSKLLFVEGRDEVLFFPLY